VSILERLLLINMNNTLYFDFSDKDKKRIILKQDGGNLDEILFNDDNTIGSIQSLLTNNNLTIDDISSSDFNENGESFTGLRISSAISNTINLFKGIVTKDSDIKLPKYSSEAHITWSDKNR